ncbi:hypothetical protein B566_EDAN011591 [Ephemera danica]|nr:hypothetical protein B566_EDAN011591 [Ephemera danica]
MNEESLTWLQTESNETSTPKWRTVRISNETETYKLLYSNQSTITGDLAICIPPRTLPPTDWKCRPLSDCVLAAFVDNADLFLNSFKCTVGTEGFLGTCCPPEVAEKQSDPQTEVTEAPEVTTQSTTDTSPQAA